MENIRNLVPPEKSVEYNQAVEQHLIDSAWKILYLHYSHYNWIDQKAQRFLTLVGAIEGYFIINFFLNRKFDTTDKSGFLMLFALLIGAIIITLYINILQSRPFYNGPNIEAQTNDFRPNGNIEDVRKDTLATLKISYQENVKIINKKARLFKISIRGICLYSIVLAGYFVTIKASEKDIPNDILLGTSSTMTTPTPLTDLPLAENLLMTEHVGAVEANDTEILKVEAEHTQEEIEHLTTDYDTSKDTSASSQPEREATLQSDNVDITEGSVQ